MVSSMQLQAECSPRFNEIDQFFFLFSKLMADNLDENFEFDETLIQTESNLKTLERPCSPIKKKRKKRQEFTPITQQDKTPLDFLWSEFISLNIKNGLSSLELADLEDLKWTSTRFIESNELNIKHVIDNNELKSGSPLVIVMASSASRCIELIKEYRTITSTRIAKLFSRHIKITEQVSFLCNNKVSIGVGTPSRILKMKEENEIFENTKLFLIDGNHVDVKGQTVLTLDSCRNDAFKVIHEVLLLKRDDLMVGLL